MSCRSWKRDNRVKSFIMDVKAVTILSSTDPVEIVASLKTREFYQFPLSLRAEVCKILASKGEYKWFLNSKGWFIVLEASWEAERLD